MADDGSKGQKSHAHPGVLYFSLQEKKRSNAPLFAAAIGFFLILPAGIVVAALSSGFLDSLGPR